MMKTETYEGGRATPKLLESREHPEPAPNEETDVEQGLSARIKALEARLAALENPSNVIR